MKGRAISYSAEELAWIKAHSRDGRREMCAEFNRLFGRDVALPNLHALCKRKGWLTGRSGCFAKGSAPHNKGKTCAPGTGGRHPNARKTQFKKGGRTGRAAQRYQAIGSERITEDGYRERKVHDGLPMQSRWQLVHRIEWEAANGPVPAGHCLKCLTNDKANCDPSNWTLIPRALLPRLAGGNRYRRVLAFDDAAPEVRPALLTTAKLAHRSRAAMRQEASKSRQSTPARGE